MAAKPLRSGRGRSKTSSASQPRWPMISRLRRLVSQARRSAATRYREASVVLAGFDRADHDKSRSLGNVDRYFGRRARVGAKPCGKRRRSRKTLLRGELGQFVERRLAIADDAGGGLQDGPHPCAMPVGLAGAAILGVRDRDEVVDEIDRSDVGLSDPVAKSRRIEPSVPDIEVEPWPSAGNPDRANAGRPSM